MEKRKRIAVVGAGIAGVAAAWSLARSGYDVELLESEETIGGNAKINEWTDGKGQKWISGLSVLAWPEAYFRNYTCLLQTLGVETAKARIKFFLAKRLLQSQQARQQAQHSGGAGDNSNEWEVFAHERDTPLRVTLDKDLRKWRLLTRWVRAINAFFALGGAPSLYNISLLNPLTMLPLRWVARAVGVSQRFWDQIFVSTHTSSFLTSQLSTLPTMLLPVLEDMISLENGGVMTTWKKNSAEVFAKMIETTFGAKKTHTGCVVTSVSRHPNTGKFTIRDEKNRTFENFDKVIFACNAHAALQAMTTGALEPGWVARQLLSRIEYTDEVDPFFVQGQAHSDASVFPSPFRSDILGNFCNYIEMQDDPKQPGKLSYENIFVISSWVPGVAGTDLPMLVSYNSKKPLDKVARLVKNTRAHPAFTPTNLLIALLLPLVQGRQGVYYCGSYATPGNGHDLSLLSGLAVAAKIGAKYPFANNAEAKKDFMKLSDIMFPRYFGLTSPILSTVFYVILFFSLYRYRRLIWNIIRAFLSKRIK